ncbi:MAG TPA: CRR6 family NdhI maturation factor [Oscillatoriales cyanobacterium M59_W2019_021]|nr:MAG: DUF1817 domain-containing protein [Cyanobacteria bacterium J055]HIK29935.1 CRR6 family NdhI maturation factor [Oscillatoriales cyanobacterium M4454_W2019_049]HIK50181.1 CRR6 family NdhI maturation factor [Oscillatoriales cyanobacterium M59_W2019_021]
MTRIVSLNANCLQSLDLSPIRNILEPILAAREIATYEQSLQFAIDYPRAPEDPRELSEIPEVRLWFVRADACYPWLPMMLDWKAGELARYAAMLVPHEFHRTEGVQYNPEALEIWLMHKIFAIAPWLERYDIPSHSRLKSMAKMFGYELDDALFDVVCAA